MDVVVLSHAHIDHSGNLPNLSKKGFKGSIFTTNATRDLCQIMLRDSARIQEGDIDWLNKHRKRKGLEPAEPLYSEIDAEKCLRQFVTLGYDRPITMRKGRTLLRRNPRHLVSSV